LGETLVENLDQAVACRFCHADVTLLDNVNCKSGLSTWKINCSNEECPSRATNVPFSTIARAKGFEINQASVLAFRTIGRGHAAASKAFSFPGLKPINDSYWTDHTKRIEEEVNKALQKELDEAAFEEKEFKFAAGEVNCSRDELPNVNVEAGMTIDAS